MKSSAPAFKHLHVVSDRGVRGSFTISRLPAGPMIPLHNQWSRFCANAQMKTKSMSGMVPPVLDKIILVVTHNGRKQVEEYSQRPS
jgi:hypothetical protein